jgi:hypothetical protein
MRWLWTPGGSTPLVAGARSSGPEPEIPRGSQGRGAKVETRARSTLRGLSVPSDGGRLGCLTRVPRGDEEAEHAEEAADGVDGGGARGQVTAVKATERGEGLLFEALHGDWVDGPIPGGLLRR